MLRIKGETSGIPIDHRWGLTTDYNHKLFYATAGVTLRTTNSGGQFIGVEIDA